MKRIITILSFILSLQAFGWNDEYKFDHFRRVDDFDFQNLVLDNSGWSIVIFNNGYCQLNSSKRDCFPFEMKLNAIAPKIFARNKNIQIINMDTESTYTHQRYQVKGFPSVFFIFSGQVMSTLSANRCYPYGVPHCGLDQVGWADNLLLRTWNEIQKIPPML